MDLPGVLNRVMSTASVSRYFRDEKWPLGLTPAWVAPAESGDLIEEQVAERRYETSWSTSAYGGPNAVREVVSAALAKYGHGHATRKLLSLDDLEQTRKDAYGPCATVRTSTGNSPGGNA